MQRSFPVPLQGVLFDLDGTLVDSEHLHYDSTLTVLERYGEHLPLNEFNGYIGWSERPFWESLRGRFNLPQTPDELAAERSKVLLELLQQPMEPLPGVREIFALLRENRIPCAIASSSLHRQIEQTVKSAGLSDFVSVFVSGYDDVPRGKPHPDPYLRAADLIGVDPKQCLAIEDSATGVASAKSAGAFVIAIPCASHPDQNIGAADLQLASMHEVLPLVRQALDGSASVRMA
jgi:HAD superfamily hydrolase (TIGR01509 family)